MEYVYCCLIGYFFGSVNPSYFIAKKKGFDIRTKGSGNAGASNALILFGKLIGITCALLDIAKAYWAIFLAEKLFPNFEYAFAVTGVCCIIGHVFPFYMKFQGGKGLACLGGMVLYFNWKVFMIMLVAAVIIALITDYICFVPLSASFAFPFVYGLIDRNVWGALILAIVTAVTVVKHVENIKRIRNGTEMRLSYLWKPDAEMARMKKNLAEDAAAVEAHFKEVDTTKAGESS